MQLIETTTFVFADFTCCSSVERDAFLLSLKEKNSGYVKKPIFFFS
jgi:hypothetical protein